MKNSEKKTEQLNRAIGTLEDYYIYEAENYVAQRRPSKKSRNLTIVLLAAALAVCLIAGAYSVTHNKSATGADCIEYTVYFCDTVSEEDYLSSSTSNYSNIIRGDGRVYMAEKDLSSYLYSDVTGDGAGNSGTEYKIVYAEKSILCEADCLDNYASEVNFTSGKTQLIWTYEGSDNMYAMDISDSQLSQLEEYQSSAARMEPDGDCLCIRMWVCDENGTVESPFLSSSAGNTYTGEIFDYEPEFEITYKTVSFLSGLLT